MRFGAAADEAFAEERVEASHQPLLATALPPQQP